eukprot:CAMPEP_0194316718 /NCGR_PEP_ID=MMETSP0171-20130528/13498_1 /TAXON_ID=218684 /ORGANISM="Corethron pennatum, Strain L29A3" /LENGTH=1056 /DNA_ID=CAMNT_0039073061 /DNA_START=483 /DNA_END=3650 /DNA_ORIENTATION=-
MGFAFGSASVVQVIKLLEPIETLLLAAIFNIYFFRKPHGITWKKAFSVVIIVLGTSMLLVQKGIGKHVNLYSVIFALCSGLAMAARNVVKKRNLFLASTKGNNIKGINSGFYGWKTAAINGLVNFSSVTAVAAIPASIFLVSAEIIGSSQIEGSIVIWMLKSAGKPGTEAVFFHGLYNMFSIAVLTLISAQSHSLLNVGKRIFNVLSVAIVFREPITRNGYFGLCLAAFGGILYTYGSDTVIFRVFRNITRGRNQIRIIIFMLVLFSIFSLIINKNGIDDNLKGVDNYSPKSYIDNGMLDYSNALDDNQNSGYFPLTLPVTDSSEIISLTQPIMNSNAKQTGLVETKKSSKYLVWMFPFPPPLNWYKSLSSIEETIICAYSYACTEFKGYSRINLRELTIGTYFYNYIHDHAYHKIRHTKDFPYHIQAITMLALLQNEPGSCVRTLGGENEFCDNSQHQSYDPYASVFLNSTNYPYPYLGGNENTDKNHVPLVLRSMFASENFAIWGAEDIPFSFMSTGGYNSGEDVQSYASATWLPFISEIRSKDVALVDYTGYYIANSFLGEGAMTLHESDYGNMRNVSMISIYSTEKSISAMEEYLRRYTKDVEAFGARSTLTDRVMKGKKIKSYFSACLTLTTDMQGAVLADQAEYYIQNEILKPNTRKLPSPQEKTKIVLVDVVDRKVVPDSVWNSENAIHFRADIKGTYKDCGTKMGRYGYSYKLLSTYANQAKVIITSRIHVGLPAAAMGVPVIFIEAANGGLPGGQQRVGRVEGLLDIFHRVEPLHGKNWTFGDLSGKIPPNVGNHLADRYRASFWHRLKKTHFYEDNARTFGMIPLQRLGQKNIMKGIKENFHFVLSTGDLCWQTQRAIEHVFFFHPNSRVFVHSNVIQPADLQVFVESGYDLVVQQYDADSLIEDVFLKLPINKSHVPFLLLWKYGGVFVSKNTLITKEIHDDTEEGLVLEEDGSLALANFNKGSKNIVDHLKLVWLHKPSWNVTVLAEGDTVKCAEDVTWTLEELDSNLAVSLHPSGFSSINILIDTTCYKVVEEICIFCDELHW